MCRNDRGWPEVLIVGPVDGARGGACSTQDALGGVIEARSVIGRLQAFATRLVAFGNEEGKYLAVGREERLHVDDQVLFDRKALDGFDGNRLVRVQILDQCLAREPVAAVDAHRVGAADPVTARAAETQRAVEFPFDFLQSRENPVRGEQCDGVVLPVWFGVVLGEKAANTEGDVGGDRYVRLRRRCFLDDRGHQYLRSIGSYRVIVTGL